MRKDKCDGLRMLVLKQLGELLRVDFLQRFESRGRFQRSGYAVEEPFRDFGSISLYKEPLGIINTTRNNVGLREQQLVKLFQHIVDGVGSDVLKRGQLTGDQLYLVLF